MIFNETSQQVMTFEDFQLNNIFKSINSQESQTNIILINSQGLQTDIILTNTRGTQPDLTASVDVIIIIKILLC